MNTRLIRFVPALAFAWLPGLLQAQPTAHYVPGVEGIKGASLPPPGFYVRDYNVGYLSSQLNGPGGGEVGPGNFKAYTYANVPRVIWISDLKFLGGFVGVDGLLPLVYHNLTAGGTKSDTFGVGDFYAESTLSWHLKQFDISTAAGTWMPTGDSPLPPTAPGLGYWTPMLTLGATWYIDSEKTWTVSALNRYEFNSQFQDSNFRPGQAYTLEWGVAKTLFKTIDLGVVGYYQQQTTADTGLSFPFSTDSRDRVAAIGPEINVAFPKPMLFVSFRYLYEFMAKNRAEGHTFALTLTKRF